ncbi:MAG: hemolysin family protein [Nitrolancea sp.]
MSTDGWIQIGVVLVSFVVLSIAATVELGLAVVNRVTIRALIEERAASHRVHSLVDRPQAIRSAVVLLELASAVIAAAAITGLLAHHMTRYHVLISILVSAAVLLIAGRIIPSIIVASRKSPDTQRFERIGAVMALVVRPATVVVDGTTRLCVPSARDGERNGDEELFEPTDENGETNGHDNDDEIEEEEHEMISGILHLDEAVAREIMVPRTDIRAVSVESPVMEVVELARQMGHSRIPVYRDSIDTIIGVVYAKDFLRFVHEDIADVELIELLRPAYFVPESKRVGELLQDLRKEKVHLAVVVDEYGGTAGIVTIEDILEEIVGEIQDEYDRELPLVERIGPDEVIVDGRIPMDELAEIFNTDFSDGDFDTIGGFVQKQLGRIPDAGEVVESAGLHIEVQAVEHRRIRKLHIIRRNEVPTMAGENP